jgi:hypothetical protein
MRCFTGWVGRKMKRYAPSFGLYTAMFGTFLPVVEDVDALKGPKGATIAKPDITIVANMAGYAMTTEKKILGGSRPISLSVSLIF